MTYISRLSELFFKVRFVLGLAPSRHTLVATAIDKRVYLEQHNGQLGLDSELLFSIWLREFLEERGLLIAYESVFAEVNKKRSACRS
jgi:hypothetical protein